MPKSANIAYTPKASEFFKRAKIAPAIDPQKAAQIISKLEAARAAQAKAAADEAKKKRLIIGGSIAGALLLVGGVVIYSKSKN